MADNYDRIYWADERMNIIEMNQLDDPNVYVNTCVSRNNTVFVNECNGFTLECPWEYFSFDIKKLVPQGRLFINHNFFILFFAIVVYKY